MIEKSTPNVYSGAVKRTRTIMTNQDVSAKVGISGPIDAVAEISTPPNRIPRTPTELANFWGRVRVQRWGCWEWQAHRNSHGYGDWREVGAHRVAYELVKGPIPDGAIIRHVCDNPACCNPDHLLPGTHQDNSNDMRDRGRSTRGERSGMARLTAEAVSHIRANPDNLTGTALARRFGVTKSTISYIRAGKTWA